MREKEMLLSQVMFKTPKITDINRDTAVFSARGDLRQTIVPKF